MVKAHQIEEFLSGYRAQGSDLLIRPLCFKKYIPNRSWLLGELSEFHPVELGSCRQDRSDVLSVVFSLGERLDPFFFFE